MSYSFRHHFDPYPVLVNVIISAQATLSRHDDTAVHDESRRKAPPVRSLPEKSSPQKWRRQGKSHRQTCRCGENLISFSLPHNRSMDLPTTYLAKTPNRYNWWTSVLHHCTILRNMAGLCFVSFTSVRALLSS